MSRGQLLSKRDDFWETSPLYGGKPEIWQVCPESNRNSIRSHSCKTKVGLSQNRLDRLTQAFTATLISRTAQALRAAATAGECDDAATAQAILDAVNVTCALAAP